MATKRKDGIYQQSVTIDGKRKYFYGSSLPEINRKIAAYKGEVEKGRLFKDVALEWEKDHEKSYTFKAHEAYAKPLRIALEAFDGYRISDISPPDIQRYISSITKQGYALRTVKMYLALLDLVFKHAIISGDLIHNPAQNIRIPRGLKTTKTELPEEGAIKIIEEYNNQKCGLLPYLLMYTGLRRGEALALRYEDIDFENKLIYINKSVSFQHNRPVIKETKTEAGSRVVILLDKLAERLGRGKGYIFGGKAPLSEQAFRGYWSRFLNGTGLNITSRQLRHLYATILYDSGIDEKMAQLLMGHADLSTTRNIYTHIRNKKMIEAAAKLNQFTIE